MLDPFLGLYDADGHPLVQPLAAVNLIGSDDAETLTGGLGMMRCRDLTAMGMTVSASGRAMISYQAARAQIVCLAAQAGILSWVATATT
ncbi:conserved hypothetical protein [Roseovarius sp. EC-HK134]|nr:conserved hypothetical protein [Roseovarius sp. EC-HK134]VVT08068.1 conserved hypothetical protein [Roseovarius sp. EC-SD190]